MSEYNEPKIRHCDTKDCEIVATHYIVWTKPMYVCPIHAQQLVDLGEVMGFPTPSLTVRQLEPHEMILNDESR